MRKLYHTIDETSFQIIYNLYFEPICRFLFYYCKDEQVVEDVVQDIFTALWENREFVEIEHIKTYLYTSARNRILNYLRNTKSQTHSLSMWAKDEQQLKGSSDCYDMQEFSSVLNKAIDTLPGKCREIYLLSKVHSLRYKDIAKRFGISVKTVEVQMSIALKRIRAYVSSNYGTTA